MLQICINQISKILNRNKTNKYDRCCRQFLLLDRDFGWNLLGKRYLIQLEIFVDDKESAGFLQAFKVLLPYTSNATDPYT